MKSKTTILIVEDELVIAQDLQYALERQGYFVPETLDTGKKALEAVQRYKPDLILIDIVLKGDMDGIMLAGEIMKHHKIPIIYTTAYSDLKTKDRAKLTRPFGYLLKPFNYEEVTTAIEIALHRFHTDRKVLDLVTRDKKTLHNLAAHLQKAREDERARIAREIHDDLGQYLTALKIDLAWLHKRMGSHGLEPRRKIDEMSAITDRLIQSVKKISMKLRPGLLDDLGLAAAMEWQAGEFTERTGIRCELLIKPRDIPVSEPEATALFRIFQEALTNTARHADASSVKVHLHLAADKLELSISDNGCGITKRAIQDPKAFGLLSMQERTSQLGGELKIKGSSKTGTTIQVSIPYP